MNSTTTPPQYGYLMKLPLSYHQQHQRDAEVKLKMQEDALRAGTLGRKPEDRQYSASEMRGHTNLPAIEISSNLNRSKGDMNG